MELIDDLLQSSDVKKDLENKGYFIYYFESSFSIENSELNQLIRNNKEYFNKISQNEEYVNKYQYKFIFMPHDGKTLFYDTNAYFKIVK
jgi:hypothetical protein